MTDSQSAPPARSGDGSDGALDESVLTFEDGLPGFPDHRRFLLVSEVDDSAFQLLQSVEDADVALIVAVPWLFYPDYTPDLPASEAAALELSDPEDAIVFCPVSIDADADEVTLNLLGPFVVNARTRQGRQVVLTDADHPTRAPVDLEGL